MEQNTSSFRRRPTGGSILMLIVLIISLGMLAPTIQQLITQRQQIASVEKEIEKNKQQIDDVRERTQRWQDPAYIRAQARGRILFVNPGDTTYVVLDDKARPAVEAEPDVSSELHETRTDSTELYLDSLIRASKAQVPKDTP